MSKTDILNEFTAEKIGQRIKELRCEQNMSVRMLSENIYMGTNSIYRLEGGKVMPSLTTLVYLALALDTTTDYILFGHNKE